MNDTGKACVASVVLFADQHTMTPDYDFPERTCPFRLTGNVFGYAGSCGPIVCIVAGRWDCLNLPSVMFAVTTCQLLPISNEMATWKKVFSERQSIGRQSRFFFGKVLF